MTIRLRRYKENLFYLSIFILLFIAPILSLYVRSATDSHIPFNWHELFDVWKIFGIYLLVFLIHNFAIAPLLVYQNRKGVYALAVAALMAVFVTVECSTKPRMNRKHPGPPPMEQAENRHSSLSSTEREVPLHHQHHEDRHAPHPPIILGQADVIGAIILFFMFGMNLAVKFYFKNEKYRKQMSMLEKQNLEHQLEYLKFQINPHFFMNTLNNIHALVDINPEKAKKSIVVLSKMMRYLLYESNNETIPLQRELAFINNYISLMRMRYTEKVSINIDMPLTINKGDVPPLLLITFVENAFKHGISYQHNSFIDLHIMTSDEQIIFLCRNSKTEEPTAGKTHEGGVGLVNVRKRLNLLYKGSYQLNIDDSEDYSVDLRIPLTTNSIQNT